MRERLRERETDRQIDKQRHKKMTLTDKQTETASIKVNNFKEITSGIRRIM